MSNPGPASSSNSGLRSDGTNPDGHLVGAATSDPVGFHGATPSAQRSGSAQAAVATTGSTTSTPYGYTTAAQADGIVTLLNEIRAALVAKGIIAGA